jgi:hypothetical protein
MSMTKGLRDYFNGEYGEVDPDEEIAIVWWCRDDVECMAFDDDSGEFTPEEWDEIADTFNMDCHQGLSDLLHEISMDVLARREA